MAHEFDPGPNDPNMYRPFQATQPTSGYLTKPCNVVNDNTQHIPPNYIENTCYRWLRSMCHGASGFYCPGFIYHKDPTIINIPYHSANMPTVGEQLYGGVNT